MGFDPHRLDEQSDNQTLKTEHSTTTMSIETQTPTDENSIPNDVLIMLDRAGASQLFLDVIQTPASEVPGANRNSSREEIQKYIRWSNRDGNNRTVVDYLNYGGGFFQSLFDGNPTSADQNNQRILEYVRQNNSTGVVML